MSKIQNAANAVDDITKANRDQIEHRATWMALIYDELKKEGLDAEGIIRRAIRRCGHMHGEAFKRNCKNPGNCKEFVKVFPPELALTTFNMHPVSTDEHNLILDFHYCALVSAWQKLGYDDKTCSLLCDIAMEGDRGIAEAMGLKLNLTDTIAKGCTSCKLHFYSG